MKYNSLYKEWEHAPKKFLIITRYRILCIVLYVKHERPNYNKVQDIVYSFVCKTCESLPHLENLSPIIVIFITRRLLQNHHGDNSVCNNSSLGSFININYKCKLVKPMILISVSSNIEKHWMNKLKGIWFKLILTAWKWYWTKHLIIYVERDNQLN